MANGHALLVGLKSVDPTTYNGWDGTAGCWGCELDVDNIDRILNGVGYQTKVLKTADATRDRILSSLYRTADNLIAGDIFVFYYSGHGGQQPDANGDELDGQDETLVAYDREVIDDKIHAALTRFRIGVRIVMISDSCNSGSNYRGRVTIQMDEQAIFRPVARMPREEPDISAQLIHLGGCRDGFTSAGYQHGGAFTIALCEAWGNGSFDGNLKSLHEKLCTLMSSSQQPQYSEYGPVSKEFRNQQAFKVQIRQLTEGPQELPVIEITATRAEIVRPGEEHKYKFIAESAGTYMIETEGTTDMIMELYDSDSNANFIDSDDDSGTGRNAKIVTDLMPGTYYILVRHYDDQAGTGAYSIKVMR